jgi:hypothetical protein
MKTLYPRLEFDEKEKTTEERVSCDDSDKSTRKTATICDVV